MIRLRRPACLLVLSLCAATFARADFTPLVTGVDEVALAGSLVPGPLFPLSSEWQAIVGGDADTTFPSTLVLARELEAGRVVTFGHEGLLDSTDVLDTGTFLVNTVSWLDGGGSRNVYYTTSHGEWAKGPQLAGLESLLTPLGYSVTPIVGPVTPETLAQASVVIVGNAWGAVADTEIDALQQWVEEGGGLLLAGLGWSWPDSLDDYPMTRLAAPFGARWLRGVIADPTDQTEFGGPVFHTFYPDLDPPSVAGAMQTILDTHAAHPADLFATLESDPAARTSFARAHLTLWIASTALPPDDVRRTAAFDFQEDLAWTYPTAYAKPGPIDPGLFPTCAWLRERFWRTWCDLLPLDAWRTQSIAAAGQLTGTYLALFEEYGLVLLDNSSAGAAQQSFVLDLLRQVPADLHDLRSISIRDFLGTPPIEIPLTGGEGGVNTFSVPVGSLQANPFPPDAPAVLNDVFAAATTHELNHVVDRFTIGGSTRLSARRDELIADAGTPAMNYLRSMFADGFFASAPQEFFASISNQWFTDSAVTLELGISRFDAGYPDPINQALFFADVYSQGHGYTPFYTTDTLARISRSYSRIRRASDGRIERIDVEGMRYAFQLDGSGRVVAYVANPHDEVTGPLLFVDHDLLVWQARPDVTGYEVKWSTRPDFATDCAPSVFTADANLVTSDPAPASVFFYLVRSTGSWGEDSTGAERSVACD